MYNNTQNCLLLGSLRVICYIEMRDEAHEFEVPGESPLYEVSFIMLLWTADTSIAFQYAREYYGVSGCRLGIDTIQIISSLVNPGAENRFDLR